MCEEEEWVERDIVLIEDRSDDASTGGVLL